MIRYLAIAAGGALGTLARYFSAIFIYDYLKNPAFPWGTLFVNLCGSIIIGVLAGLNEGGLMSTGWKLFLFVGILGGFTTFSSFSLETMQLFRQGQTGLAITNILVSNFGGLALAFAGFFATRSVMQMIN